MAGKKPTTVPGKKAVDDSTSWPECRVLGVVAPFGAGGGQAGNEVLWTLRVQLEAWRVVEGKLIRRPLSVTQRLTDAALRPQMELFKPYATVCLRVRLKKGTSKKLPQAVLLAFEGEDSSDAELAAIAEELQKPVIHEDPKLGTFTLDRRLDYFNGQVVWNGQTVVLDLAKSADVADRIETSRRLLRAQKTWKKRVEAHAVHELLPIKNDGWLGDDETEFTPARFVAAMRLEAINVSDGGRFSFWYDDGNLFWGHTICVSGTLDDGPIYAEFMG